MTVESAIAWQRHWQVMLAWYTQVDCQFSGAQEIAMRLIAWKDAGAFIDSLVRQHGLAQDFGQQFVYEIHSLTWQAGQLASDPCYRERFNDEMDRVRELALELAALASRSHIERGTQRAMLFGLSTNLPESVLEVVMKSEYHEAFHALSRTDISDVLEKLAVRATSAQMSAHTVSHKTSASAPARYFMRGLARFIRTATNGEEMRPKVATVAGIAFGRRFTSKDVADALR